MRQPDKLGTQPITRLLISLSLPACSGMLMLMLYNIVDTMFIGHYVGAMAIAGLSVVLPISMLLPTLGMAIGTGSSSIISRSLGAKQVERARLVFGNAISLAFVVCSTATVIFYLNSENILFLFGGRGEILPYAQEYFQIIALGLPILGTWMCLNNTLRAEGHTRQSVRSMFLSSVLNIVLDAILIVGFDMGLTGAAIATVISQFVALLYNAAFYWRGHSQLCFKPVYFRWNWRIISETCSLGASTMGRQGAGSAMVVLLNQSLFLYGGASAVAVYGVLHRIISLLFVPIIGMTQSFLPIVGFNYGARQFDRVREVIFKSIFLGSLVSFTTALLVWLNPALLIKLFTNDPVVLELGSEGLRIITVLMPLAASQNICAAYFQAIGKPVAAFLLTISRQVLLLIPMLLILPKFFGITGVWVAFPVSDFLGTVITITAFMMALPKLKDMAQAKPTTSVAQAAQ